MQSLTITRPDDFHIHLRDEFYLKRTVNDIARTFNRVLVMPNLKQPVTTVALAQAYFDRILQALDPGLSFEPLMSLYLTDNTDRQTIIDAKKTSMIKAGKLYPMGATTNSDFGVSKIEHLYPVFEEMQREGLLLLIHGELLQDDNFDDIDVFDREKLFIDKILTPICKEFTNLKVVLEHITTKDAVSFVQESSQNVAATITPHHLWYNRNHIFNKGINPHFYCLPILKRKIHQEALIKAATSGNSKFFLGTDSAPHEIKTKESACGCAGIYCGYHALELYAQVFEEQNALDKLEGFASFYGADFYQLPRNTQKVTLIKQSQLIPPTLSYGQSGQLVPMCAGQSIDWQVTI